VAAAAAWPLAARTQQGERVRSASLPCPLGADFVAKVVDGFREQ
jgi:hypothetical protein